MKSQTIVITDVAPASGETYFTGLQNDYDVKKDKIRVLGIVTGAVAKDGVTGDAAELLQGLIHIDRQNPSEIIFGTSIYKRLNTYPEDKGLVVPIGIYMPCDFELTYPNYLGIVGDYSLPIAAAAIYQVTTYITFLYEEINAVSRRSYFDAPEPMRRR